MKRVLAIAACCTLAAVGSAAAFAGGAGPPAVGNDRPLIGILAQACHDCPGRSYVAAAYVKWVESAGGRAVPIRFYVSDDELKRLFHSVNGIIFPGGLTDLYLDDPYVAAATKLYTWAAASNDAGTPFPIWGTCLGHQLLQIIVTGAHFEDLLVKTDAVSQPSTLNLTAAAKASRLFGDLYEERPTLVQKLGDPAWNIAMENHEFGLPTDHFFARDTPYPQLAQEFEVLSTSVDRGGVEYVSTIEHKRYPFWGVQWHPEKPPFEFSDRTIPKSHAAMSVSHYLADQFLDAARACPHAPASVEQELADVIYNYKPVFTAREIVMEASYDGPDITYFFDKKVAPADEPRPAPSAVGVARRAALRGWA